MKKIIKLFLALHAVFLLNGFTLVAQDHAINKGVFRTFQKDASRQEMEIEVYFNLKEKQVAADGLSCVFSIVNGTTDSLTIFNPVKYLKLLLFNKEGYNLVKSNKDELTGCTKNNQIKNDRFQVEKMKIGEQVIDGIMDQSFVTIPSAEKLELTIKVKKIKMSEDADEMVNIVPGEYKIRFVFSLIEKKKNGLSQLMTSEKKTVTLM